MDEEERKTNVHRGKREGGRRVKEKPVSEREREYKIKVQNKRLFHQLKCSVHLNVASSMLLHSVATRGRSSQRMKPYRLELMKDHILF